jgi:hypothetical protein
MCNIRPGVKIAECNRFMFYESFCGKCRERELGCLQNDLWLFVPAECERLAYLSAHKDRHETHDIAYACVNYLQIEILMGKYDNFSL